MTDDEFPEVGPPHDWHYQQDMWDEHLQQLEEAADDRQDMPARGGHVSFPVHDERHGGPWRNWNRSVTKGHHR